MSRKNPNKVDHLNSPAPCQAMLSEVHEQFQKPVLKKPPVTRSSRLEQFLWHEFYDEYIRAKQRLEEIPPGQQTTEYYDEFNKRISISNLGKEKDIQEATIKLVNKFPLYSTNAITVWNPKGEFSCNFRRTASITIPTADQRGQFDA